MGGALSRKIALKQVIQYEHMGKSLFGPVSILSDCLYKVSMSKVKLETTNSTTAAALKRKSVLSRKFD